MKQLFLAFLLVGLVTLLVPSLRERAQPRIDESREWLGQKLEGPLSPVLTPMRTLKTQSRQGEVVRLLVRERNRGQPPPRPDGLVEYLERHDLETLDGWGAPFILVQEPDSVAIISPGPDVEYRTDDDIVVKVRYDDPAARRFRVRR